MSSDVILDNLDMMIESMLLVLERFSKIRVPDEFALTPEGVTLLDSISMRLQVIGESVKQIQKINPSYLKKYPEIEWDRIAKFRDLVSHHYAHVDHEIIYDICKSHIPKLQLVVNKMREALLENGNTES